MISFRVTIYNIVLPENNPVKGLLFGLKSYGIKQGVGLDEYLGVNLPLVSMNIHKQKTP
jgi:hypothetical protein